MSITLTGVDEVRRGLISRARFFPRAVGRAIKARMEAVKEDAQTNYVPVDKGVLRDSAVVSEPVITFSTISVEISFGGPGIDYAVAVHEHLSEHSPPSWVSAESQGRPVRFHPSGHGPKYLELPLKAATAGLDDKIAIELRTDPTVGAT